MSCELDYIPKCLLKFCYHTLNNPITKLLNVSLEAGVFTDHIHQTYVYSVFTKLYIIANHLNIYRPLSNLSFISKALEKVGSSCLNVHLNYNHLSDLFSLRITNFTLYRNRFTEGSQRHITNPANIRTLTLID